MGVDSRNRELPPVLIKKNTHQRFELHLKTSTNEKARPEANPDDKPALKKDIGLWGLVSLGVGGIVGAGVFGLPTLMGSAAGPGLILAVLFVGIIVTLLALIYAELGSAFPVTGGPYSIPRLALGDTSGFVLGWGYFLYAFTGTAYIIDIMVAYAGYYMPVLANGLTLLPAGILVAIAATVMFTAVNVLGVRSGTILGIVTTVSKLVPLLLFGFVGIVYLNGGDLSPFLPFGWGGVGLAMAFGFFSFTGFEAVVIPSEEVKNPSRNIPRAMVITMAVVVGVYLLIAVAFTGLINWSNLSLSNGDWANIINLSSPLSDVSKAAGMALLASVITVGAVVSTVGAGNSWILFQGRMPYAMSRDGLFWGPMHRVHPKYGTPYVAIIFASILTIGTEIALPSLPDIVLIASITTLIPYAAASVSLPILRKNQPGASRPFRLPAAMIFAAAGFVLATILAYWASWPWTLVGLVAILVGFPLYLTTGKRRFELKRQLWLVAYVAGIAVISYLGDPTFIYNNFLPIQPIGLILMPYDIVVLTIFSLLVFAWAYISTTRKSALS